VSDPGWAYAVAKQAVLVRIRAAAPKRGLRNARVNSISPGTIAKPMGDEELASPRRRDPCDDRGGDFWPDGHA
jgi:NAD(P)-dependent dehydrogenase (short-subunit alcohol dehydrogenase family)